MRERYHYHWLYRELQQTLPVSYSLRNKYSPQFIHWLESQGFLAEGLKLLKHSQNHLPSKNPQTLN